MLYETAFGRPRREAADSLEQCLQRHGATTDRTILDVGAGRGRLPEEAGSSWMRSWYLAIRASRRGMLASMMSPDAGYGRKLKHCDEVGAVVGRRPIVSPLWGHGADTDHFRFRRIVIFKSK